MARRMQLHWDWQSQRAGLEYSLDTTELSTKPGTELTAGSVCSSALTYMPVSIWAALPESLSKSVPWSFISNYCEGSCLGSPGLWWGNWTLKIAKTEWVHVRDVAQTCHWCCWVGCIEQACLPAHESLPPRNSSSVSKMLPAKCFELPGTRCGTNSLIIVANLQLLGSASGNTKKGMGLGRQKQVYLSTPGCCLLRAFPSRDTKPLLLSLSKSYAFVWEELPLLEHKCYIFFFLWNNQLLSVPTELLPSPRLLFLSELW